MKNGYIPKIGDVVELTPSNFNFNDDMEAISKEHPFVIVLDVFKDQEDDKFYVIKFKEGGRWQWTNRCGHFKFVQTCKEIDNLEPLLKILNEIKLDKDI